MSERMHDREKDLGVAEKTNKSHEALARKYRPQVFADVVAQQHVTQTLANAIRSGRIAQAYLFVGPRGVGKTTLARIYAKALNCEKGPTPEPCCVCDICRAIAEGRCLDVMEFDAASNTQVDRVRDIIIDNIGFAPAQTRYKLFIIDEVHMLSPSSFNALLKTLEEPPAHVRFVFATTEPQKIPATILSRCQRFDLRRIPTSAIVATLQKIAKLEKVNLEADAALAIARGAEGGLRDAESALDQLIAFCGDTIRESDVLSVFGLVAWTQLVEMAGALLRGDVAALLQRIADLDAAGKDLSRLSVELLEYFRDLLVVAYTGRLAGESTDDEGRLNTLREQARLADAARISRIADLLVELQGQLRHALSRRTLLEVALVRAARAATAVSLDEVLAALDTAPVTPPASPLALPLAPAAPVAAPIAVMSAPESAREPSAPAMDDGAALTALRSAWPSIVEKAGLMNPIIRNSLKDAKPLAVEGDCVRLVFDPEFASSRDKLNVPRNMQYLQKVMESVLRRPVTIELEIGAAPPEASGPETAPAASPQPPAGRAGAKRDWSKEDVVRRALDAFNGEIADVRE
jgi:DNA polymerase-3 subunit gamma/tau